MLIRHFFTPKLAHSSYILAGSDRCAVVDPSRDVARYLEAAEELGVRITHVLQTHLHADFVSGHIDLAGETGAEIVAPLSARCAFPHRGVREGDNLEIQNISIDVLDTPGHTPEHVSFVVTDTSRGGEPAGVFCGDTLFVGDAGRPDLFPGKAEELASALLDSLGKLTALPDHCEIYPAHGAGSLCGRSMASKYTSTIGYEKRFNPALRIRERQAFIKALTTGMPPAPDHFSRCSQINGKGPTRASSLPIPVPMSAREFFRASRAGSFVLDVRRYDAFAGQHVPGALSIDFNGNLPTFAGWIVPPDPEIILVATDPEEARNTAVWLRRVGLDRVRGFLKGGMWSWALEGLPTRRLPLCSVHDAANSLASPAPPKLVDVRAESEFEAFQLPGAVNIPAPDLRTRHTELDPRDHLLLVCSGGQRSTMAGSLLLSRGFESVASVSGGMQGFHAASLAPACPMCSLPHGPLDFRG